MLSYSRGPSPLPDPPAHLSRLCLLLLNQHPIRLLLCDLHYLLWSLTLDLPIGGQGTLLSVEVAG